MPKEMNSKEALIEVSKSCKALAREFGDKMYKRDAKALNVLKDTILENAKLKEENTKLKETLVKFDNDHFQHYFKCARAIKILKPYIKISMRSLRVITFPLNIGEEYELLEEVLDHVKD